MSFDVSLSSIDFDKFYSEPTALNPLPIEDFHKVIFAQDIPCSPFRQTVRLHGKQSDLHCRIQNIAQIKNGKSAPMSASGKVSVEVNLSWGDSEGVAGSVETSAEARDDNGNQIKVAVEQSTNGKGSARVSASHDKDK